MRNKLILLTALMLLFVGYVTIKFFILDKQNIYGRLKIISSPIAAIFIDNLAVGKTPYEDKYKIGEFLIKLIPEGNATETASWQGKIKIYKNVLSYVNFELGSSDISTAGEIFTVTKTEKPLKNSNKGEIYVETEPNGAIVYLDNDEKGVAPVILADVLRGDHELSVFMPGFFRRTQKINITPGYRVNAYFKLAIDQTQRPSSEKSIGLVGEKDSTETAKIKGIVVVIKETPTGWLRVREEPSLSASETAKVKPGERFEFLEEKEGWYKIRFDGKEGWVSSVYSDKENE